MTIDDIHKNIVRVNEGSGIILKDDNKHYVFTAYHNVKYSISCGEAVDIKNDKNIKINTNKSYYQKDKDIALFEVDYTDDISVFKSDNDIKANDKITFIGYPDKGNSKRKRLSGVIDEWTDKTSIKVSDNINPSFVEEERASEIIVGFSGSAVFKIKDDEISFIGLLCSIPEKDFYYNEISCISIRDILYFLNENNLSILNHLKTKENEIISKNEISNNPIFNFRENNNSPINTGSGNQYITIHNTHNKSFEDGKKLFDIGRFDDSANIFHKATSINPNDFRSYFYYCIARLSSVKNISTMSIKHINCIYLFIDILDKTNYRGPL